MVPTIDVIYLASKPRKICHVLSRHQYLQEAIFLFFSFDENDDGNVRLFLARPKPSSSTTTVKSRLNSDQNGASRSRPGVTSTGTVPVSAGKEKTFPKSQSSLSSHRSLRIRFWDSFILVLYFCVCASIHPSPFTFVVGDSTSTLFDRTYRRYSIIVSLVSSLSLIRSSINLSCCYCCCAVSICTIRFSSYPLLLSLSLPPFFSIVFLFCDIHTQHISIGRSFAVEIVLCIIRSFVCVFILSPSHIRHFMCIRLSLCLCLYCRWRKIGTWTVNRLVLHQVEIRRKLIENDRYAWTFFFLFDSFF